MTAAVTAAMTAAFLLTACAMLTGGTGEPAPALVPPPATTAAPQHQLDVLPFVPGPNCRDIDDWTADLPTTELPVITVRTWLPGDRVHTSPSETLRQRWAVECPIFAALAAEHGYHPVRGFTPTELVAA